MRYLIISIYCILPQLLLGQYTYFNNGYLPPYPKIGSGQSNSLFVRGDTLFTYGFAPSPDDDGEGYDYVRYLYYLDNEGILINEIIHLLNDEYIYMDFSDNYSEVNNGYVSSTGNDFNPVIMWCDNNFTELFRVEYPEMNTDTTTAAFFTSTTIDFDNTISVGHIVYDLIPELPGQNYANLILAKHDAAGNEIWFHEYSASDMEIDEDYSGPFLSPRGGAMELGDSSILVFSLIGNDNDCGAFKFDSLGNYIDHVSWGHPTYSDGSAWPVQIGQNEFLFCYNTYSSTIGQWTMFKPRIGRLDTNDMSIELYPTIDHELTYGAPTDMEATSDGNFIILGYGYGPDGEDMGRAYLLKVDDQGNEIWYKEYYPPENWDTPTAYDLEITSDGGFAFVGNYHPYDQGVFYYKTWVVKTDACGDLIDAGCEPNIQITELQDEQEALKIYPNPVQDVLTISYQPAGIATLELYDATGRLVLQHKVNDQAMQHYINVGELPASLYELRLMNQFGAAIESVVVIKK